MNTLCRDRTRSLAVAAILRRRVCPTIRPDYLYLELRRSIQTGKFLQECSFFKKTVQFKPVTAGGDSYLGDTYLERVGTCPTISYLKLQGNYSLVSLQTKVLISAAAQRVLG